MKFGVVLCCPKGGKSNGGGKKKKALYLSMKGEGTRNWGEGTGCRIKKKNPQDKGEGVPRKKMSTVPADGSL